MWKAWLLMLGACGSVTIAHSEDTTLASSACSFGPGHFDVRITADSLLDEGQVVFVDVTLANADGPYTLGGTQTLDCDDWTGDGLLSCKRDVGTSPMGHLVLKQHSEVTSGTLPAVPQLDIGVTIFSADGSNQTSVTLATIDCTSE
jgi:hypothetical protein